MWNACALPADAPLTPLHTSVNGAACQRAPPTQPCLRSVLEQPEMCRSATVRDNQPGTWANSSVPLQVGAYGNSGSIMSRALLQSVSEKDFEACEKCKDPRFECMFGADWRLSECFLAFAAHGSGIGPTLPSILKGDFRKFGFPAEKVLELTKLVIAGEHCDEQCALVLNNISALFCCLFQTFLSP